MDLVNLCPATIDQESETQNGESASNETNKSGLVHTNLSVLSPANRIGIRAQCSRIFPEKPDHVSQNHPCTVRVYTTRDATLKEVRSVHESFLKGTTDRVEDMDVRFASLGVAIGTVTSIMSAFTMPDGVKHGAERHVRTFVLVKRGDRWLIMQDQNTTILRAAN